MSVAVAVGYPSSIVHAKEQAFLPFCLVTIEIYISGVPARALFRQIIMGVFILDVVA
jgi:hypothetical protein